MQALVVGCGPALCRAKSTIPHGALPLRSPRAAPARLAGTTRQAPRIRRALVVAAAAAAAPAPPPAGSGHEGGVSTLPLLVLGAAALGLVNPGAFASVTSAAVTTPALAAASLAVGLTLKLQDVGSVLAAPGAVLAGVALQFTAMPLMAFAISRLANVPLAAAIGLCIVGCSPGGAAANLVAHLARADVPLSMVLSVAGTVGAAVATPFLSQLLLGVPLPVDVAPLLTTSLQVVLLPVLVGAAINTALPRQVAALAPLASLAATASLALVAGSVVAQNATAVAAAAPQLLGAVFAVHAGGFLLAYSLSRALGLSEQAARTASLQSGMRNSAMAAVLASVHFAAYPLAAVACALSACMQPVMGSLLAAAWHGQPTGKQQAAAEPAPAVAAVNESLLDSESLQAAQQAAADAVALAAAKKAAAAATLARIASERAAPQSASAASSAAPASKAGSGLVGVVSLGTLNGGSGSVQFSARGGSGAVRFSSKQGTATSLQVAPSAASGAVTEEAWAPAVSLAAAVAGLYGGKGPAFTAADLSASAAYGVTLSPPAPEPAAATSPAPTPAPAIAQYQSPALGLAAAVSGLYGNGSSSAFTALGGSFAPPRTLAPAAAPALPSVVATLGDSPAVALADSLAMLSGWGGRQPLSSQAAAVEVAAEEAPAVAVEAAEEPAAAPAIGLAAGLAKLFGITLGQSAESAAPAAAEPAPAAAAEPAPAAATAVSTEAAPATHILRGDYSVSSWGESPAAHLAGALTHLSGWGGRDPYAPAAVPTLAVAETPEPAGLAGSTRVISAQGGSGAASFSIKGGSGAAGFGTSAGRLTEGLQQGLMERLSGQPTPAAVVVAPPAAAPKAEAPQAAAAAQPRQQPQVPLKRIFPVAGSGGLVYRPTPPEPTPAELAAAWAAADAVAAVCAGGRRPNGASGTVAFSAKGGSGSATFGAPQLAARSAAGSATAPASAAAATQPAAAAAVGPSKQPLWEVLLEAFTQPPEAFQKEAPAAAEMQLTEVQIKRLFAPADVPAGAADRLPAPVALAFFFGINTLLGMAAAALPAVEFMQSWDSKLRGTHRRHLAPSGAARALPRALPCAAPEPEPKPRDTEAILQALLEAVVGKEPFWVLPAATTSGIDSAPASAATPTGERSSAQPADDRLPAPVALTIYASFSGLLVLAAMATPTVEFLQSWDQRLRSTNRRHVTAAPAARPAAAASPPPAGAASVVGRVEQTPWEALHHILFGVEVLESAAAPSRATAAAAQVLPADQYQTAVSLADSVLGLYGGKAWVAYNKAPAATTADLSASAAYGVTLEPSADDEPAAETAAPAPALYQSTAVSLAADVLGLYGGKAPSMPGGKVPAFTAADLSASAAYGVTLALAVAEPVAAEAATPAPAIAQYQSPALGLAAAVSGLYGNGSSSAFTALGGSFAPPRTLAPAAAPALPGVVATLGGFPAVALADSLAMLSGWGGRQPLSSQAAAVEVAAEEAPAAAVAEQPAAAPSTGLAAGLAKLFDITLGAESTAPAAADPAPVAVSNEAAPATHILRGDYSVASWGESPAAHLAGALTPLSGWGGRDPHAAATPAAVPAPAAQQAAAVAEALAPAVAAAAKQPLVPSSNGVSFSANGNGNGKVGVAASTTASSNGANFPSQ